MRYQNQTETPSTLFATFFQGVHLSMSRSALEQDERVLSNASRRKRRNAVRQRCVDVNVGAPRVDATLARRRSLVLSVVVVGVVDFVIVVIVVAIHAIESSQNSRMRTRRIVVVVVVALDSANRRAPPPPIIFLAHNTKTLSAIKQSIEIEISPFVSAPLAPVANTL